MIMATFKSHDELKKLILSEVDKAAKAKNNDWPGLPYSQIPSVPEVQKALEALLAEGAVYIHKRPRKVAIMPHVAERMGITDLGDDRLKAWFVARV
jgi:hypothetical protein